MENLCHQKKMTLDRMPDYFRFLLPVPFTYTCCLKTLVPCGSLRSVQYPQDVLFLHDQILGIVEVDLGA